jgi:hypothetical protein
MYSSGVWSLTMGTGSAGFGGGSAPRRAPGRNRGDFARARNRTVALDLLLLAVHEPDVVAEEQVQVLVAVARQLLFDRLELEQQVVAESAEKAEPRILLAAEFVRSARAEWKTPRAACCAPLPETAPAAASGGPPGAAFETELLPVGMSASTGENISAILRPRSLSGRNSTRRS